MYSMYKVVSKVPALLFVTQNTVNIDATMPAYYDTTKANDMEIEFAKYTFALSYKQHVRTSPPPSHTHARTPPTDFIFN